MLSAVTALIKFRYRINGSDLNKSAPGKRKNYCQTIRIRVLSERRDDFAVGKIDQPSNRFLTSSFQQFFGVNYVPIKCCQILKGYDWPFPGLPPSFQAKIPG